MAVIIETINQTYTQTFSFYELSNDEPFFSFSLLVHIADNRWRTETNDLVYGTPFNQAFFKNTIPMHISDGQ